VSEERLSRDEARYSGERKAAAVTRIIALFGPTAVGKTEVAVALADLLRRRGEDPVAVSADAFQVYEGLDLLAAKPDPDQLALLEHRLVSAVPVERTFSVAEFAERAHAELDALIAAVRRPIVVGGTGLYLRAALTDLDLKPPPDPELREEIEQELATLGAGTLHARLRPETAGAVHPRDRKRIVRALELERMGERPPEASTQLWSDELRRPAALFGIVMDREELGRRIDERVGGMMEEGAIQDVERALERGASRTARKAIGFAEIEAFLAGTISLDDARARIARRHRQYAKRQLTWMRKLAAVELVDRTGLGVPETAASVATRLPEYSQRRP
jgi:tRNA dimethylallyltransferase